MMVIPILFGDRVTEPMILEKELSEQDIKGRSMIIQTTRLVKSDMIFRRVFEIWTDMLSFRLQWKTIS